MADSSLVGLSSDQLRILGEAIGRGIVREAARDHSSTQQFIRSLLGVDPIHPSVTFDRWVRLLGETIGKTTNEMKAVRGEISPISGAR